MILNCFPPQRPSGHRNHQYGFLSTTTLQQFQLSVGTVPQHSIDTVELGLDEATLRNYPKLIYASTRATLPHPVAQYAWLITMTRMCCACYLIVVISFILNVWIPGYGCILHVRCVETRLFLRWRLHLERHP
ncbi:hypothetical protein CFP56_041207 [Quercus suber]|uniref:Uncharacterized protein n=1 Tax=Quercus suber TaxID=58331 RepID=A0AAW0IW47_QUESU